MLDHIKSAFNEVERAYKSFSCREKNFKQISEIAECIAELFENKGKILICGNGGSLCDALHFAEEFTGRFRKNRKALPVLALADPAHMSCVGNDFGFNDIFSRALDAYGTKGDLLIVLSTSGKSENLIRAIESAQDANMKTASLLGKTGGRIAGKCDFEWIIQGDSSDRIQEVHMSILHIIIEMVERKMFPELY